MDHGSLSVSDSAWQEHYNCVCIIRGQFSYISLPGSLCLLGQWEQLQYSLDRSIQMLPKLKKCPIYTTLTDPGVIFPDANSHIRLVYSLILIQTLPQSDSVHVQTHHSHACGQCHRGVDPWPQWPLVKAEVVLVVGPQAFGAILSQDLDGEARCNKTLWGLPQLHVEVLPQATQPEMDSFAAALSVWWVCIWGQGSASSPALVMGHFMRDVNTLVVDLIRRYNLIFWMRDKG